MTDTPTDRALVLFFRLAMAWTFLYAASHQIFDPAWTVVGFLSQTKTFHALFSVFTTPTMAPVTTFLVESGHLLIGLSLLTGLLVRVSAGFGIFLMAIYWMATWTGRSSRTTTTSSSIPTSSMPGFSHS